MTKKVSVKDVISTIYIYLKTEQDKTDFFSKKQFKMLCSVHFFQQESTN